MSHCDSKHEGCHINAEGISLEQRQPRLPSRVIDLACNDSPYLLATSQNQRGLYTILSHCWGQTHQLHTFSHNMSEHRQRLPWDLLCKTYQEAIAVTRSLKVRYLWIDSLCIVQDSNEDWKRESAQMAQYYGDAYCTIAADAATDGSKGLFVQANNFVNARLPVETFTCNHVHTTMVTNKQRPCAILAQDPMHKRAWCVQERLLSRRTLHFSSDQVYFECRRCLKAEDGRYYGRGSMSHSFYEVVDLKELGKIESSEAHTWDLGPSQRYYKVVAWYSTCLLTYPKDKLQALVGLQESYSKIYGAEFRCGLWFHPSSSAQTIEILWREAAMHVLTNRELDRCDMSVARSFPTWSWASCDVSIELERLYRIHWLREVVLEFKVDQPVLLKYLDVCSCRSHRHPVLQVRTKIRRFDLHESQVVPSIKAVESWTSLRSSRQLSLYTSTQ